MKIQSFFLALLSFIILGVKLQSSNEKIYPFVKNPELSWQQFEQDFRQRHNNIEIPPIVLDNQCDFAPMYIDDPKDPYLYEFNKNKSIPYQPPFIIINFNTVGERGCVSPNGIAWILLHETGHHNYGEKRRIQNHAYGKKIAMYGKVMGSFVLGLAIMQNLSNLMHNKFSCKSLCMSVLIGVVLKYNKSIVEGLDQVADDLIGSRQEEYFADNFANQHATKEELQAIQYYYSPDRYINRFIDFLGTDKNGNINQQDKELYESIIRKNHEYSDVLIIKVLAYVLRKIALVEYASTALVLSHPSHQSRYEMVTEALKNRFGIV